MKNLRTLFIAVVTLITISCSSEKEDLQEEVANLKEELRTKQETLNMYEKLPFARVKNPLNENESILLKNPRSWVVLDSSLKDIEHYSQELLTKELGKTDYRVKTELNGQKMDDLIRRFKTNNPGLCKRWAASLLDNYLNLYTEDQENFEENPAYQKLQESIDALYNENDSLFTDPWEKVRVLKEKDTKQAWETFKAKN